MDYKGEGMLPRHSFAISILLTLALLAGCSLNPFSPNNNLTGTATGTLIGAGAGAGAAALVHASSAEIFLAGLTGGALGYYVTSLPFVGGGVTHVGGKVYTLGDYATIEIPADALFDVNSSDFLPEAPIILDSAIAVLNRYPKNNIMISGNTAGFYGTRLDKKMSEERARQVAAYLWAHGISNDNFGNPNQNIAGRELPPRYTNRELTYVGYGSHFPISNTITPEGIRQNSRIQINSYPFSKDFAMNKCGKVIPYYNERYHPPQPTSTTLTENQKVQGDDYVDQSHSSTNLAENDGTQYQGETWDEYVRKHPGAEPVTTPIGCSTRNFNDG